jgi:DNA-binding MarR family transcriptional regulator
MGTKMDAMSSIAYIQKEYLEFCYRQMDDRSLNMTQMVCILFLFEGLGDTSVEIAKKYRLSPSMVSKSVDVLRSGGYLTMERDALDSRKWHLQLTQKCLPIMEKLSRAQLLFDRMISQGISEAELETLKTVAKRLYGNLERIRRLREPEILPSCMGETNE